MKRRALLARLGALSLGAATPGLLHGEEYVQPYTVKKKQTTADVLVVGGGTAGTIAAIQAGRAGMQTILVESGSQLGGTTTTGGVAFPGIFFAWGKQVIGGIGWELVQESVLLNNDVLPDFSVPHGRQHWKHQVRINPAVYVLLAEEKCVEAGVELRFYETPVSATFKNGHWKVLLQGKGTSTEVICKQLIDTTGNAFVASMAGFPVLRESETQPGTLMFTIEGFDAERLDMEKIKAAYAAAVARGELVKGEVTNLGAFLNNKGDTTPQHIAGADSSTSETHTLANIKARSSALRTLRFFKEMPGCEQVRIGMMRTEVAVRETYRIDGLYKITHEDYISGRKFDDALSYSYYPIDLHDAHGVVPKQLEEGMVPTIPFRALIPKNSRNFIVAGRCLSSDRLANSALRVQASCMGMGQAAGAAAALACKLDIPLADVPVIDVQDMISQYGGIVPK
ncbi:FAD-dependent oxidoreductase [Olivibacter sp. SDN3]|uniref:FAD-dependent oxidoreductase n=1 Tax=Olivibacter sp. SDN3 TaxID=2764720 RepID=UPI001650F33F|nr:FAD-dependent oxidoreductase [Olivibacter sp. SDN3]QNL50461.1 FAD-dependent oxidoreductase [Olivibacter sp. SDN3]